MSEMLYPFHLIDSVSELYLVPSQSSQITYISGKKIHLNFNIKNLYFVWYYVKNNLELLEKTYNSFVNEDYKIINNLSIKSDKPIVSNTPTDVPPY